MTKSGAERALAGKSWRTDAVRIVDDLFAVAPSDSWDLLLDLRLSLTRGNDWNATLDIFLTCRERLEAEQYLPFYRLRRLFSESLRLEAVCSGDAACVECLQAILRRKHRSLEDIKRAVRREVFEHLLDAAGDEPLDVRVVEQRAPAS